MVDFYLLYDPFVEPELHICGYIYKFSLCFSQIFLIFHNSTQLPHRNIVRSHPHTKLYENWRWFTLCSLYLEALQRPPSSVKVPEVNSRRLRSFKCRLRMPFTPPTRADCLTAARTPLNCSERFCLMSSLPSVDPRTSYVYRTQ